MSQVVAVARPSCARAVMDRYRAAKSARQAIQWHVTSTARSPRGQRRGKTRRPGSRHRGLQAPWPRFLGRLARMSRLASAGAGLTAVSATSDEEASDDGTLGHDSPWFKSGNTQNKKSLYHQSSIDFRCYPEMALVEAPLRRRLMADRPPSSAAYQSLWG